jgi:hypothetical protein
VSVSEVRRTGGRAGEEEEAEAAADTELKSKTPHVNVGIYRVCG